jgi:hypothetical protein
MFSVRSHHVYNADKGDKERADEVYEGVEGGLKEDAIYAGYIFYYLCYNQFCMLVGVL